METRFINNYNFVGKRFLWMTSIPFVCKWLNPTSYRVCLPKRHEISTQLSSLATMHLASPLVVCSQSSVLFNYITSQWIPLMNQPKNGKCDL